MTSYENYSQYYVFVNKEMAYSLFSMSLQLVWPTLGHKLLEGTHSALQYIHDISIATGMVPESKQD